MLNPRKAVRQSRSLIRSIPSLLLLVLLLFLPRTDVAEPLETFAQALTRHHIELTKPALIEALRNPDEEVRGLAAWQLLEMKAYDALPQILQALRDERDARTRVNLASAAAHLGAKEGNAALAEVCHDSAAPGWVRTDAARHMFDNHHRACLPDLWSLMVPGNESETRIAAMSLVSQLPNLTALESAQILNFTVEMLNEPDIFLRLNAAIILASLRDTTAIPYLRTAIQVESEEAIRYQMEASLSTLLASKHGP